MADNKSKPKYGGARYDNRQWGIQTVSMTSEQLYALFDKLKRRLSKQNNRG